MTVFIIIRCWDFIADRGRIFLFAMSFRTSADLTQSLVSWVLGTLFTRRKVAGAWSWPLHLELRLWMHKALSLCICELWIVQGSALQSLQVSWGPRKPNRKVFGQVFEVWSECLQNLKALCQCINLQSHYGYLWRLLVKLELLSVSVSAPFTCVGGHIVMVFCSNTKVHCLVVICILLFFCDIF